MRSFFASASLLIAAIAHAQNTAPKEETPKAVPEGTFEQVLASTPAVGQQHLIGIQMQFGTPTGFRGQVAVHRAGDHSFLLEGFAGARSTFWGEEPVLGFGGRAMFNLASDGRKNAFVFAPGIGISYWGAEDPPAYYRFYHRNYEQTDRWYLNLDANIGWLHELTPTIGWELGVNFGARIGFSGQESGGEKVSGHTSGNIGLYTGFRY